MQDAAADAESDAPPRVFIFAAVAVALAAIAAVIGLAATRRTPPAPVVVAGVPAPQSTSPECTALIATLPQRLGDFTRADTAEPTPAGTAAWRPDGTNADPVILRCGLDRPAEFVVGAPLQMVNDVAWFRLDDGETGRSTWVSVDRPAYVALTLPTGSGPAPIQTLSEVIARTMPAVPIRPGAAR